MTNPTDTIPAWEIQTYDMGRHWLADGDYQSWYNDKRANFEKHHVYMSEMTYSTNSGGVGLLFNGIKRGRYEAFIHGLACPECHSLKIYDAPDDTAIHLVEHDGWEYEKARLWLRGIVEGQAFNAEP